MRVLRTTIYPSPLEPMTGVVCDRDLVDTLESFLQALYTPGVLVVHEIFSAPDDIDHAQAVYTAVARINPERELDMAVLYFWQVAHLRRLKAHGVLTTKDPTPLSAEAVKLVMKQIIAHPDYKNQTLIVHDETGSMITYKDGKGWS